MPTKKPTAKKTVKTAKPTKKPAKKRRRTYYVAFWLSDKEEKAFFDAVTALNAKTNTPKKRSEYLRMAVAKFADGVKFAREFD